MPFSSHFSKVFGDFHYPKQSFQSSFEDINGFLVLEIILGKLGSDSSSVGRSHYYCSRRDKFPYGWYNLPRTLFDKNGQFVFSDGKFGILRVDGIPQGFIESKKGLCCLSGVNSPIFYGVPRILDIANLIFHTPCGYLAPKAPSIFGNIFPPNSRRSRTLSNSSQVIILSPWAFLLRYLLRRSEIKFGKSFK